MPEVLVTGGAGFLGSHIADELSERGHHVTVFDHTPSPWLRADQSMITGDITDASALQAASTGKDYVYHLAALADLNAARSRPMDTVDINIAGTIKLLEACRHAGVKRFIFASSVYVYSREGSFYRCSKQACESYIEEYQRTYGLDYSVLRFGSLYGPRADQSNGVFRLLKAALENNQLEHNGSPDDRREYIHVTDAAHLSADILDDAYRNRHVTITGQDTLRIADLFTMFSEMLGKPLTVDYAYPDGLPENGSNHGHYGITPYAYTPKPGRKLTTNNYVDMGQGLLEVIEQIDQSK